MVKRADYHDYMDTSMHKGPQQLWWQHGYSPGDNGGKGSHGGMVSPLQSPPAPTQGANFYPHHAYSPPCKSIPSHPRWSLGGNYSYTKSSADLFIWI